MTSTLPRPDRQRQRRATALLLVLMALLAYAYWIPRGALANSDAHLALTRAIVDERSLAIDRYAQAEGLVDRAAFNGHYYTDKAPGLSLLAVPIYAAFHLILAPALFTDAFFLVRYLVTAATVGLPAALWLALLWRFYLPLLGRRWAALLVLGYGLGTMAWGLSALLFSHMLTALCLFSAFMLLEQSGTRLGARDYRRTATRWAGVGALCGLAVGLEYPAAPVALWIGALAGYRAWRANQAPLRSLAVLMAAAALTIAPVALYNTLVYGNPLSQGYAHLHGAAEFQVGMAHGVEGIGWPDLRALWGITFSPYRGLFVLSPFLLLALPGVALMWHRPARRPAALVCCGVVITMLVFNSAYYFWDGGVSVGPRHLAPALPFLLYPVAFALRARGWRRLAPWLIGLSIAIVALCCTTVLIFLPGIADPLVDLALRRLLAGQAPNNWGMVLGLRGEPSLLPFVGVEVALGALLWRTLRPRPLRRADAAAQPYTLASETLQPR